MPIKVTCPGCQTTLAVADTARGKQVRCSGCKQVFTATPAGNGAAVKPANGNGSRSAAAKPKAVTPAPAARTKAPAPRDDGDEVLPADTPKKKKSMLPACLIGCGVLFLLCGGGGSIGGYFGYQYLKKAANDKLDEIDAQLKADADRARDLDAQLKADPRKAEEEMRRTLDNQKRIQEEMDRAFREAQERQKGNKPPANNPPVGDPPAPIDNVLPPDNPPNVKPPDNPKPPDTPRRPVGEVVQPVAQSIPLGVKPTDVFSVLWTGEDGKQAVVVERTGKNVIPLPGQPAPANQAPQMLRHEQFDLTSGRKLGVFELPFDGFTSVRDLTPDARYFLCNHAGTSYAVHELPDPRAVVDTWLPRTTKPDPGGAGQQAVAAYLLPGPKILTVQGNGELMRWTFPGPDGKPQLETSFLPPESVAKYPAGLGYGYTALSPDRKKLAVFNGSNGFFLVNTDTMQLDGELRSPEDGKAAPNAVNGMLGVAFSPDGSQLAAVFHQQLLRRPRGTPPSYPQLVRWDVAGKQLLARIEDPSRGSGGAGSRVGWCGKDHFWVIYINKPAALISWAQQKVVLRGPSRLYPNSPDGKCWYLTTGTDGNAVLRGVDLPAAALADVGDKPLSLSAEGVVRR